MTSLRCAGLSRTLYASFFEVASTKWVTKKKEEEEEEKGGGGDDASRKSIDRWAS